MTRWSHILCTAAALAAAAGCSGGGGEPAGSPDSGPTPTGELALGTAGDDGLGFVAVEDGQDITLIGGAQGGFHIWTTVSAYGVSGRIELVREARQADDGALVLRAPAQPIEIPDEAMDDWWQSQEATPSFMCPSPVGIQVFDHPLILTGRLFNDDDELLAEDSITVTPRCPTGDLAANCLDICSGN